MQLIDSWKLKIQEIKWKTLRHNNHEFSNAFVEKKIQILKDFFHPLDLQIPKASKLNGISDPSQIWIIYLLSQQNIGTIQLINLICDVIEFFKKKDNTYLEKKLLNNSGRINKNSFRNDFFEVWFNYLLFKKRIEVNLDKCYRNKINPDDEGVDSDFRFNHTNYVVECTKLNSWKEEILGLTYQMIEILQKRHLKFSSNPHFDKFVVYAIPTVKYHIGKQEFDKHLNNYFFNKINKKEDVYTSSSKAFKEITIFTAVKNLAEKFKKLYGSKECG